MPKKTALRQILAEEGLVKTARYRLTQKDHRAVAKAMDQLALSDAADLAHDFDIYGRWAPMVEDILQSMGDTAEAGR